MLVYKGNQIVAITALHPIRCTIIKTFFEKLTSYLMSLNEDIDVISPDIKCNLGCLRSVQVGFDSSAL